ncbi:MAG: hypothetical protein IT497_09330, partial [Ottowia sp.]|nr:hypothetical protein [Ottowia sp.]
MRFLSLFQHDSSKPLPRTGGSSGEDLMLALKQRARRRLVGAVVLVVATVITLPLIFDSGQKKGEARTPNIAHTQPILSAPSQAVVTQAQSLIETDQSTVRGVQRKTAQGDVSLQSGRALSTGANVRDMATTSLSDGEIVMQDTRVEGHKKEIGSASSVPLAVKFSIKAGAFASEERARNWVAKLKA